MSDATVMLKIKTGTKELKRASEPAIRSGKMGGKRESGKNGAYSLGEIPLPAAIFSATRRNPRESPVRNADSPPYHNTNAKKTSRTRSATPTIYHTLRGISRIIRSRSCYKIFDDYAILRNIGFCGFSDEGRQKCRPYPVARAFYRKHVRGYHRACADRLS